MTRTSCQSLSTCSICSHSIFINLLNMFTLYLPSICSINSHSRRNSFSKSHSTLLLISPQYSQLYWTFFLHSWDTPAFWMYSCPVEWKQCNLSGTHTCTKSHLKPSNLTRTCPAFIMTVWICGKNLIKDSAQINLPRRSLAPAMVARLNQK